MEISYFPLLDDYSPPFSFFQDSEPKIISFSKRPRCDNFDNDLFNIENGPSLDDLLTELLEFVEENPAPNLYQLQSSSLTIDPNYNQSNGQMVDSYYYLQNGHSDPTDSGNSPQAKRARSRADDTRTTLGESSAAANGGAQRRLWVKNRSKAWWELVDSLDFPEEEFKKAFRMSRATFDFICDELKSIVTKKDTMLRSAIPVRQCVAVCIWRLATGEALREVSKHFGLGSSTCHNLVLQVCTTIKGVLMPKFLQLPDDNSMVKIKSEFESFSGISNIVGSMYTTHIPITAPKENAAAYYNKRRIDSNQKISYSITVQGVVDPRGVFTDISIGWPGSMTDDQILEKSALFQRAKGCAVRDVWIAGNSGYPLMDWLLVPYTHQNLSWVQHVFNEKMEGIERVGKESFGRLKARWRCLQKRTEMKLQDSAVVLVACCVLHNVCEVRNEGLGEELRFEGFDDVVMIPKDSVRYVNALRARDQIARRLLHCNFEL